MQVVTIDPAGRVNVSELATSLEGALLSEENKSSGMDMYVPVLITLHVLLSFVKQYFVKLLSNYTRQKSVLLEQRFIMFLWSEMLFRTV